MKPNTRERILLAIAFITLGVIFILGNTSKTVTDSFANEPVKVQGFDKKTDDKKELPTRILIPELKIDLSVKEAKIKNGYWEVFDEGAAWGEASGVPGEPGNQVIFAHAREGLFLPLKEVKTGEKIYVLTKGKSFDYEVKEIKEVFPNQVEVIAPTTDETLTLYTCSGFKDSKRLIIIAKRV